MNPNNKGKNTIIIVVIILIILIALVLMRRSKNEPIDANQIQGTNSEQNNQQAQGGTSNATQTPTSGGGSTQAGGSVNADLQAADQGLTGLDQDSSDMDKSINDKPIQQDY